MPFSRVKSLFMLTARAIKAVTARRMVAWMTVPVSMVANFSSTAFRRESGADSSRSRVPLPSSPARASLPMAMAKMPRIMGSIMKKSWLLRYPTGETKSVVPAKAFMTSEDWSA